MYLLIQILIQLIPYLARELSENMGYKILDEAKVGSPLQGEKRSRSCVAASLFGQDRGQVGLLVMSYQRI
ncbi:MAG: hypothetical protein Tsb0015_05340 [Simkaniaceae bacterium]